MTVSILGDSISTYQGMNPENYAVFYAGENCTRNHILSVNDTWWQKVIDTFHLTLCVNGSYSGSKVSGYGFPAANSDTRIHDLANSVKGMPNIILVYIGFNDFGNGIPIKGKAWKQDEGCFQHAYMKMIKGLKKNYPKAGIFCATLMRTYLSGFPEWEFPEKYGGISFSLYNDCIRSVCRKLSVPCIDFAAGDIRYETLDGSHPTALGHDEIAGQWVKYLNPYLYQMIKSGRKAGVLL